MGNTARHLTFFEMLGNFSIGDYFKPETIAFGWELSLEGLGLDPARIWVTVFEGEEELGLGPDTEAIELWRAHGVPEERIVRLPRSENFWQAGPSGPCGPSSEMYLDRGEEFGGPTSAPGTTPTASSSTGTTSSWRTSCTRTEASPTCRRETSTPGSGLSEWPRSSRTFRRSSSPTFSSR